MTQIKLKGNVVNTIGSLPEIGKKAKDTDFVNTELQNVSISNFKGKNIVLNIFPSIDTAVCSASVRRFNSILSEIKNTVVLCISMDLPFAHKRFCGAEGLDKVISLSSFRNKDFGKKYGVTIIDGPLAGLFSRAVVVINEKGRIVYTQQVPDIVEEPDYTKVVELLHN